MGLEHLLTSPQPWTAAPQTQPRLPVTPGRSRKVSREPPAPAGSSVSPSQPSHPGWFVPHPVHCAKCWDSLSYEILTITWEP